MWNPNIGIYLGPYISACEASSGDHPLGISVFMQAHGLRQVAGSQSPIYWVAVKDLQLNYQNLGFIGFRVTIMWMSWGVLLRN